MLYININSIINYNIVWIINNKENMINNFQHKINKIKSNILH